MPVFLISLLARWIKRVVLRIAYTSCSSNFAINRSLHLQQLQIVNTKR